MSLNLLYLQLDSGSRMTIMTQKYYNFEDIYTKHSVGSVVEDYYAAPPMNTAQVTGQTLMMTCKGKLDDDMLHEWLGYITTENGHRIGNK